MRELGHLSSIADEMLAGLQAGPGLKEKIWLKRSAPARTGRVSGFYRGATVVAGAMVLAVGVGLALNNRLFSQAQPVANEGRLTQIAAGSATQEPLPNLGWADVPDGSLRVGNGQDLADAPKFQSLFAGSGANYPLIGHDGKAFRRMSASLPSRAVGEALGVVSLNTGEPSLADSEQWQSSILSNVAQEGANVYQIDGLSPSTALGAEVDGKTVLFQRVSYAGYGTSGQSLEDTLDVRGKVSALILSGVGTIGDAQQANALMDMLLDNATFYNDQSTQGKQSLTIELDSGVRLQLLISGEVFSACGSWSCPEFFDAFRNAM